MSTIIHSKSEKRSIVGMREPLCSLEKRFNGAMRYLLWMGAFLIAVLVGIICLDIFSRLVLKYSFIGVMEVETLILVVLAFSCMGYTIVIRGPIQIDLFYEKMSHKSQRRLDMFSNLLCLSAMVFLAVIIIRLSMRWKAVTAAFFLPEKWFILWTGLCYLCIAIGMLFQVFHSWKELRENRDWLGMVSALLCCAVILCLPFIYKFVGVKLDGLTLGLIAFFILMTLLLLRVPIGIVMALIGILGMMILSRRWNTAFNMLSPIPFRNMADFVYVAYPMFVLMGELINLSGISRDLFECANKWVGRQPGGLAMASVWGCAGFGAVCGDSLATAVTMGGVALPAMRDGGYNPGFACSSLAAGGTLGILIPPSMGFIYYSIMTEESVGRLFVAGIVPGILLTVLFCVLIAVTVKLHPEIAPKGKAYPLSEKVMSLVKLVPVILLFVLVVGGILMGIFTPGEGGAVGCLGAIFFAAWRRTLTLKNFWKACVDTALMCGKIFLIFTGVWVLGSFLASSKLPLFLADSVVGMGVSKYVVLMFVILLYIVLGAVMNIVPMMLLTLPAIYPTIMALGFDGIWFGVVIVILMEMGMITPPVGMNVFALASTAPDVPMASIYKYVLPFFLAMLASVVLLVIFPEIALFLPNMM